MKKIFKSCSIYKKPKCLYIFGYLRTPFGGIGRPPLSSLPLTASQGEIGDVIFRIFNELSGEVTEVDLASASAIFRSHLKEVGIKSVAALEKNAFVVDLEFDGDFYSVFATQKDEHGANIHTGCKKLSVSATADDIGAAIVATFAESY